MDVHILIFGHLTDITGTSQLSIENVADTDGVQAELKRRFPALADASYAVALDKKIVSENTGVTNNSTVALLPPFSGG